MKSFHTVFLLDYINIKKALKVLNSNAFCDTIKLLKEDVSRGIFYQEMATFSSPLK